MAKELTPEEVYIWSMKIEEAKNDLGKLKIIKKALLQYSEDDPNVKVLIKKMKR